ncbi:MAG: outer membrane beta-barrel protein, partial [Bacteroidales bacterium]|nr:outer membrane beta-barrel protein [Bacteroidales bacterium]
PSEIVDKVQIFDKLSDQAQFTGFNDGNTEKTMNIVTKNGKSNGQFGKIYGGIGDDGKYQAGLNLNYFSGQQRISLLGLSNNINQQNFSMQDILGVMNTGSQSSRSSRSSGRSGFSSDLSNFMTGQQGGINTTHSYGLNYSNKWSKKASISASYFFNNSKNETSSKLARQYLLGENSTQYYNENSGSSNNNYNHRFNARFTYNIDSLNSIILTPRLSFQDNKSSSGSYASTLLSDTVLNSDNNSKKTKSSGYNFSNNLLFRHKFNLKRRTFSLNFNTAFNDRTGTSNLYSLSEYYIKNDTVLTDQFTESSTEGKTIGANINYTEPVGKKAILQFTLYSGYNENNIDKYTYLRDTEQKLFTDIDSTLSNDYSNKVYTQRAGLSYRYSGDNFNFSTGFNLQNEILKGKQLFPYSYKNDYNFNSLLPTAMFFYKFTKTSNLRMFYRSSTNTPDANQLQDVIDNSNPLSLKAGNPELKQDFSHNLIARFGTTNINKATSFFGFVNFGITDNRIANAVYLPVSDTIVNAGKNKISLSKGTQLTLPVNLDGYRNLGSFLTFGFPASFIKCNINLNGGVNYNRLPGLINNRENISENYSSNGGAAISSNISEKIDFNLSYSYNYNFVENTIQSSSDNNYSTQTASGRLYLSLWKGLTLNSDISYILYKGLGAGLNQDLILLNGGLSYKFLKNNAAEIKLSIYDLLNENKSISRTITDTYIEDSEIKVLKRYMMLSFTYNIRNFKSN